MEWKTVLKKWRRLELPFAALASRRGSRSLIVVMLRITVVLRAMHAITARTLNWVFPKNQTYFGRSMYPAT